MNPINSLIRPVLTLGMVVGLSLQPAVAQSVKPIEIDIVGSELIADPLTELLEARAAEFGVKLDADFAGSQRGEHAMKADVADIGIFLENPQGNDFSESWVSMPVGHIGAFVIAPRDLTVDQLTFEDLARIFSADSAVANSRWGDFGADGRWGSIPITAHVTTPAEGLSYEIFRHRVLPSPKYKVSVKEYDSTEETRKAMFNDDAGIGVVPWWDERDTRFKALLIAPSPAEVAFGPTPQNMAIGDYPLAMTLSLVFERARATELLPWLKYWYSDEVSEALREANVMPLPRTMRNQLVFDLEVVDQSP